MLIAEGTATAIHPRQLDRCSIDA